jgi:hypothetical protein
LNHNTSWPGLRSKVIGHAATLLQCGASELDLENGEIGYGDGRSTDLTIGKIARDVMLVVNLSICECTVQRSYMVYRDLFLDQRGRSVSRTVGTVLHQFGLRRMESSSGDYNLRLVKAADGANDNWTFLHDDLPAGEAVVDFFHAAEHLSDALSAAYGDGSIEARERASDAACQPHGARIGGPDRAASGSPLAASEPSVQAVAQ